MYLTREQLELKYFSDKETDLATRRYLRNFYVIFTRLRKTDGTCSWYLYKSSDEEGSRCYAHGKINLWRNDIESDDNLECQNLCDYMNHIKPAYNADREHLIDYVGNTLANVIMERRITLEYR
jgi:hypothetical protein|tara:strand:- start:183 stop:551 length:369 start_codon:yes stop_codon:yes gene_type:complete